MRRITSFLVALAFGLVSRISYFSNGSHSEEYGYSCTSCLSKKPLNVGKCCIARYVVAAVGQLPFSDASDRIRSMRGRPFSLTRIEL